MLHNIIEKKFNREWDTKTIIQSKEINFIRKKKISRKNGIDRANGMPEQWQDREMIKRRRNCFCF